VTEISKWLAANQALLVSLGIPVFTVFVGFFGSYLVHKSKADEIRLAGRVKLSEYRKENFDELIKQVDRIYALVESICFRNASNEGLSEEDVKKGMSEMVLISWEIASRIRAKVVDPEEFDQAVLGTITHLFGGNSEDSAIGVVQVPEFRALCRAIVRAEWELIESELKRLA
jgi:hypothetical protein